MADDLQITPNQPDNDVNSTPVESDIQIGPATTESTETAPTAPAAEPLVLEEPAAPATPEAPAVELPVVEESADAPAEEAVADAPAMPTLTLDLEKAPVEETTEEAKPETESESTEEPPAEEASTDAPAEAPEIPSIPTLGADGPDLSELDPKTESTEEEAPAEEASTDAPAEGESVEGTAEDENVFTKLFGDDKVMQSSDIIDTYDKNEEISSKSIFSSRPDLNALKKKFGGSNGIVPNARLLIQVSAILFVLSAGFFYTQNSAGFTWLGTNPVQQVEIAKEDLREEQAELEIQKHLTAALLLDQFSVAADAYLYNIAQSESTLQPKNKRPEFKKAAIEEREKAVKYLANAQDYITPSIPTENKVIINTLISELIKSLEAQSDDVDAVTLAQDVQDLKMARSIVQKDAFRSDLARVNTGEITDEEIEELYNEFNGLNKNIQAVLGKIRSERMTWSQYFEAVEKITKDTDPLFNTEFPGSIKLSNVRFEQANINISGNTSTEDSKNFTLVSNFIDNLDQSDEFQNAEDRSFNKNQTEEEYSGQFTISLDFE